MTELTPKDISQLLKQSFIDPKNLVKHHIDSYNYFITYELPKIFASEEPFTSVVKNTTYVYKFDNNCFVSNPVSPEDDCKNIFTPLEAEHRNLSYMSTVYVTIYEDIIENGTECIKKNVYQNVPIAQIPTMVHSIKCNLYKKTNKELIDLKECPLNPGGYFVTNGTSRTIIAQERANFNQTYIVYNNAKGKNTFHAEIRSVRDGAIKPQKFMIITDAHVHLEDEKMSFNVNFGSIQGVNLSVILSILGFSTTKYNLNKLFNDIIPKLNEEGGLRLKNIIRYITNTLPDTHQEAIQILVKHQLDTKYKVTPKDIIENELLPHMDTIQGKLMYLFSMIKKLVCAVLDLRGEDDRDNFSNKRLDVTGVLFRDLFRLALKKWIQKHIQMMTKQSNTKTNFEKNTFITTTISKCVNTGTWGLQKSPHTRTGVCQMMSTGNYLAFISHGKRTTTPIGREGGALKKIRVLHASQYGAVCPNESPDGPKIGIIKNLASYTRVTVESSTATITNTAIRYLEKSDFSFLNTINNIIKFCDEWCLYINGKLIGIFHNDDSVYQFVYTMKNYRRQNIIYPETSIVCDKYDKEVRLHTDSGRFVRPVFVLDDGKLKLTGKDIVGKSYDELARKGHIQWIDSLESEYSLCAMSFDQLLNPQIRYQYVDLHPSIMLGLIASMIPFPHFSQSPRNCYASNMLKQSQGAIGYNYMWRFLTTMYSLWYPQKPLLTTQMARNIEFTNLPSSFTATVAVMCYASNQEDSLILKKSFLERGGAVSVIYCVIDVQEKRKEIKKYETIEIPPVTVMKKNINYNKLDKDGIVPEGVKVFAGDVLVGKTFMLDGKKHDCSYIIGPEEEGTVDKVIITTSVGGNKLVKIKIRNTKVPICGDKLAAFNGQKATIGMIENEEDMPFDENGITPDIILSPEALPSRMTMNYILEMLIGKAQLYDEEGDEDLKDCTAFNMLGEKKEKVINKVSKILTKNGFRSTGSQMMMCGKTGRQIPARIFIGPMGYMRLKHMVGKKVHSRGTGKVQVISMQPTSGRSNDGGLRFKFAESNSWMPNKLGRILIWVNIVIFPLI